MSDEKRQIPLNQERLEKAITGLYSRIGELSNGLEPVMKGSETVKESEEAAKEESLVPYAAFLRNMSEKVENASEMIRDICRRLQV